VKYLEELGKSLLNFANLGTILIFFKLYFSNFDIIYLISGIVFFIGFYTIGLKLIKKSERVDNGR